MTFSKLGNIGLKIYLHFLYCISIYIQLSSAMFVNFNRLLFKSISHLPLLQFSNLLSFSLLLPFVSFFPFSLLLIYVHFSSSPHFFPISPSWHTPSFLTTPPFLPIPPSLLLLLSYLSLLFLLASFPCNTLFLCYTVHLHIFGILLFYSPPLHSFLSVLSIHSSSSSPLSYPYYPSSPSSSLRLTPFFPISHFVPTPPSLPLPSFPLSSNTPFPSRISLPSLSSLHTFLP